MKERLRKEFRLLYSSREQSFQGKRITYLDMLRGLAIFLVVAGHCSYIDMGTNTWLSTFHLPAFFIASGMLLRIKKEDRASFPEVLKRKCKGILIPYIWFSLAALALDVLQVLRGSFSFDVLTQHILQTVTLQGYSVLWFLPVLFLGEIATLGLLKTVFRKSSSDKLTAMIVCIAVTALAFFCYLGYQTLLTKNLPLLLSDECKLLCKVIISMVFISFGYVLGIFLAPCATTEKRAPQPSWQKALFLLLGCTLCTINIFAVPHIQIMDFNNLNVGNLWIYLGLGCTGTMGLLLLCKTLPNLPLLTFWGQNSLIIMCTHLNFYVMYIMVKVSEILSSVLPMNTYRWLFIVIGTMFLEIPVILVIRTFFPFVLGKKYKSAP